MIRSMTSKSALKFITPVDGAPENPKNSTQRNAETLLKFKCLLSEKPIIRMLKSWERTIQMKEKEKKNSLMETKE